MSEDFSPWLAHISVFPEISSPGLKACMRTRVGNEGVGGKSMGPSPQAAKYSPKFGNSGTRKQSVAAEGRGGEGIVDDGRNLLLTSEIFLRPSSLAI